MTDTTSTRSGGVFVSEFSLEQFVYLRTDDEQKRRIVVAVSFQANNGCQYQLSYGTSNSWHYACEISSEKNALIEAGIGADKDESK